MRRQSGREHNGIAPVNALDRYFAITANDCGIAEGSNDFRLETLPQYPQSGAIKVVVMVVGDQNHIDRRQIVKSNTWRIDPLWPEPFLRTGMLRIDRIDQQIDTFILHQKGRMADE